MISVSLAFSVPSIRNSLVSDKLAAGSRKVISLIKSVRTKAGSTREPYLIFYDSTERKLWYQLADEEEESEAHGSVTLPEKIYIQQIQQKSGGNGQDNMSEGIWVSSRGYMDKTVIQLTDRSNEESLYLLISPFLPDISISEAPIDLQ